MNLPFETDKTKISLIKKSDFDQLKSGMTRDNVEAILGKAHYPYGSTLANLCYDLDDGTTVILFYRQGENGIIYLNTALLINSDGTKIKLF